MSKFKRNGVTVVEFTNGRVQIDLTLSRSFACLSIDPTERRDVLVCLLHAEGIEPDVIKLIDDKPLDQPQRKLIIQNWEDRERGWGARPGGWTIHLSLNACQVYVDGYNRQHNNQASAPDEYTRTSGSSFEIFVDEDLYLKIEAKMGDRDAIWGKGGGFNHSTKTKLLATDVDLG